MTEFPTRNRNDSTDEGRLLDGPRRPLWGEQLVVWWGDELLDVQHGRRPRSPWTVFADVDIRRSKAQLEVGAPRSALFAPVLVLALGSVSTLGWGAWKHDVHAAQLLESAQHHADSHSVENQIERATPSWIPPEECVPPSKSNQSDERPPTYHNERAEHIAWEPDADLGSSNGASPRAQRARGGIVGVLNRVAWDRPSTPYQNALTEGAGAAWWNAGGDPGEERIRIVGTGRGGGGTGIGTIALSETLPYEGGRLHGQRGCSHMCCFAFCGQRARPPRIHIGEAIVSGGLAVPQVRRIARRHSRALLHCYEQGRLRNAMLKGEVTIHFFVSPNGRVLTSVVAESNVGDAPTAECIASDVERWSFPQTDDGSIASISLDVHLLPPVPRLTRAQLREREFARRFDE